MFVLVILTDMVITALCITIGWMFAGMPNFFEPPRSGYHPHDPDYFRARWKAAGYTLHLPSYRNGAEKYVLAKDANSILPESWLHGLYSTVPEASGDY